MVVSFSGPRVNFLEISWKIKRDLISSWVINENADFVTAEILCVSGWPVTVKRGFRTRSVEGTLKGQLKGTLVINSVHKK